MKGNAVNGLPSLVPCPRCRQFIQPRELRCTHCGCAVKAEAAARRKLQRLDESLFRRVERLLTRLEDQMAKAQKTTQPVSAAPRAVYDHAIREVLREGNLTRMKRTLVRAKRILHEQGDLASAVKKLDEAVRRREKEQQ